MENAPELRARAAQLLEQAAPRVSSLSAFVGLDGFIDEIIHVVDQRMDAENFKRIATITGFSERLAAAAGRSTNIELVNQRTKLGGNGPIMANALVSLGLRTSYLGALGFPDLHPIFKEFSRRAEVFSIAESGHTNALEFEDGKIMMGKSAHFNQVTWENIQQRMGRDKFAHRFASCDLVSFVNWTMIPYMSDLWEALLGELCPALTGPRRKLFFDLADPEKRPAKDVTRALELILQFNRYFDVTLGLNEKEAYEIGEVLGLPGNDHTPEGLAELSQKIQRRVPVDTLTVHPVAYALAISNGVLHQVKGPYVARPVITTGAGDHFNAGFCLGKLLGLGNEYCLLSGVTASGHYVRTGHSPALTDLIATLRDWPAR